MFERVLCVDLVVDIPKSLSVKTECHQANSVEVL